MSKVAGLCKLCGCHKELVDSHIIPKSFYFRDKDEIDKGVNSKILSANDYPQRSSEGVYDQIVCGECEKSFGCWDDYAAQLLKCSKQDRELINPVDCSLWGYEYRDVDYSKLKMFFMSLLWRVNASTKGFFSEFQLPESLADELLAIVRAGVLPPAQEWAVFVGKSRQRIANVIAQPFFEKIEDAIFAGIYLPGYVVHIKLNDAEIPRKFLLHLLHPGTGLAAYFYDFYAGGEAANAFAMVEHNFKKNKRKQK